MSIAVRCQCGKQFKVKERLAGKAVRCPGCKGPLRIPGTPVAAVKAAGSPGHDDADDASGEIPLDQDAAVKKYEDAQKKKQMTAEAEAAYREEQNKLIDSYDQIAGRTQKDKKKKGTLAETGVTKPTIKTKTADAFGIVCGNALVKYIIIAALFGAGMIGSVYGVKYVAGYMNEDSAPQKPKEQRIEDLFKKAEAAIEARRFSEAKDALAQILREDPAKEQHRRYKALQEKLQKSFDKPA